MTMFPKSASETSELLERMRGFEVDHKPEGWPAIRMREVSALCDALEAAQKREKELWTALEECKQQANMMRDLERADAARLDWLADPENMIGAVQLPSHCVTANPHSLREAIDMAMRENDDANALDQGRPACGASGGMMGSAPCD